MDDYSAVTIPSRGSRATGNLYALNNPIYGQKNGVHLRLIPCSSFCRHNLLLDRLCMLCGAGSRSFERSIRSIFCGRNTYLGP